MFEGIHSEVGSTLHQAVLEALPDPVVVHDHQIILYANPAALQLLRASERSEVIGMPVSRFTHPISREPGEERRRLILEQGVWMKDACVRLDTCDGCTIEVTGDAGRIVVDERPVALLVGRTVREV